MPVPAAGPSGPWQGIPGSGRDRRPNPECLAKAQKARHLERTVSCEIPRGGYTSGSGRSWKAMNDSLLHPLELARKAGKLTWDLMRSARPAKMAQRPWCCCRGPVTQEPEGRDRCSRTVSGSSISMRPSQMGDIDRLCTSVQEYCRVLIDEGFVRMFLKHLPHMRRRTRQYDRKVQTQRSCQRSSCFSNKELIDLIEARFGEQKKATAV